MELAAEQGAIYLDAVQKFACHEAGKGIEDAPPPVSSFPHYDFGAMYSYGEPYLTAQTVQMYENCDENTNRLGRKAVADFCAWFYVFSKGFIHPLIISSDTMRSKNFQDKLGQRIQFDFPWAAQKCPGLDEVCQPFYSTIVPIKGFETASHVDEREADPSILVNFGQHAILELLEYNSKVELQPLDIVIFSANRIRHRVVQHPKCVKAGHNPAKRWSITCFFLQALAFREEPNDDILAYIKRAKRTIEAQFGESSSDVEQTSRGDRRDSGRDTAGRKKSRSHG
ncbi:uncharacterized protein UTRI_00407 [Ustilago trichophora]|uniref:Uncharacterized protein n=1 Tax=Ustilago trichophora TaxID=86804 RepID=A0A5C3DTF2_9BASI|nr:uncharacterized protein UTRI_00407 [Ustilago trichophora]